MTLRPAREARYFFPAFLTFDKSLIEIINLYPLKACAFVEGQHNPMPFFDGDWLALLSDDPATKENILLRFYSDEALASREERRDDAKSRVYALVSALEKELSAIAAVPTPFA